MSQVRSTLWMVLAFATRLAAMLLGAVIALALFHGDGDAHEDQNLPTHVGRAYIGEDGDIAHVVLNVEPNAGSRALVLHDSDGRRSWPDLVLFAMTSLQQCHDGSPTAPTGYLGDPHT
jgi:hypothetical protein